MRNTTKLLLIIVIIISNIVVMSIPTIQGPFSLKSCSMTSDEILSVMKTTVNDKASLETFIRSKIKADGEIKSEIVKFPSLSSDDRFLFKGSFTSGSQADSLLVAVFSDDGVTVKVNNSTSTLVNMYEKGQALPDVANSLKVVSGNWQNSTTYDLEIQYSNISHPNGADIDGITVFFLGNVTIVPPVAAEPVPVNTSLTFTDGKDKLPYTGNTRTVKATVGLVVNGSGIDPLWGTKEWTVNVVNSDDPTVPLATRTFTYVEDKLSYSDDNVDIVLPINDGEYNLKAIVKNTNLESVLCIDIYKIVVKEKPEIVAGSKDDINHKGIITIKAVSGTKNISGINIKLNVSNEGTNIDDKYKPYLTDNLKITDGNGEAFFEITSGQLVSNEQSVIKFGFIPESEGVTFEKFNINISDENINIYLINIITGENIDIIHTDGDVILLKSNILFSNNKNIANHKLEWKFSFYTYDIDGNKTILYNGDNKNNSILYGTVISPDENFSDLDGNAFALFITGSEIGWLSWECIDDDVFIDNSIN